MDLDQIDHILTGIAREHLRIETLETRRMCCLDFHDVAVWCLPHLPNEALQAPFNAGVEEGRKQAPQQAGKATASDRTNG
jgi:hypothetical protein